MAKIYVREVDNCINCPVCTSEMINFTKVRLSCELWEDDNGDNLIGEVVMSEEKAIPIPHWCMLESV